MPLPEEIRRFGVKSVLVIHNEGADGEARFETEAHIQPKSGFFAVDTPLYEGDVVEYPDPRGGTSRKSAARVNVRDGGSPHMHHIEVEWGTAATAPLPAVTQRVEIEGLHAAVVDAAGDLFGSGHYSQAIFEALKALEQRVRVQSGLDLSGRALMADAIQPNRIDMSVESGQSGRDEQEGFRVVFMGVMQGIRNPKGHELITQADPQRALEYLALVSILFRRLDDAQAKGAGMVVRSVVDAG